MSMKSIRLFSMINIFFFMMCFVVMAQVSSPPGSEALQQTRLKENLSNKLNLKRFDRTNQSIVCGAGVSCTKTQKYGCIAAACASANRNPTSCIVDEFKGDRQIGDNLLCQVLNNPSAANRSAFLNAFPGFVTESELVQVIAMVKANQGNAAMCQSVISEYIGYDMRKWTDEWLIHMSGCRILGWERTREQEENDYLIWRNVQAKKANCGDIRNLDMRNACFAGVKAP